MTQKQLKIKNELSALFQKTFNEKSELITPLAISGSSRRYYRISNSKRKIIGTYSNDKKENKAFFAITEHLKNQSIQTPEIYATDLNADIYLQEDMGIDTLYDFLQKNKSLPNFKTKKKEIYKNILKKLIHIQTKGIKKFDFSVCYPRSEFDKQSIQWDLNYFKYMFLKTAHIDFNEQTLEEEFSTFTDYISQAKSDYFMYRDFQSRNIMYNQEKLAFIDYQGGRKGALQYDLASLLYDAKAELSEKMRSELTEYYSDLAEKHTKTTKSEFYKYYNHFVLLRIMQAMGSYGYRGIIEGKSHFKLSIAPAQKNLKYLLKNNEPLTDFPELKSVLTQIIKSEELNKIVESAKLKVNISSFSYKRAIPYDKSGNGGGFVFDCRFLNNPGRLEKYKNLTGKDPEVINFLQQNSNADIFAENCLKIITPAINNYSKRQFTNLNISFGCTGGQHRSVYLAEKIYNKISKKFNTNTVLTHHELPLKIKI